MYSTISGALQFHDGMGFLTSHSLLTNTFEFSLQKVNPKLALPYWDFTIEPSSFGGAPPDELEPQSKSPVLQETWFGSSDPEDGMVRLGADGTRALGRAYSQSSVCIAPACRQ